MLESLPRLKWVDFLRPSDKTIKKIGLPRKSLIVAIERNHKFIIPTDDVELFSGDKATILAHKDQVDRVAALFSS